MGRKKEILFANRNQTGWWIYDEVGQWISNRQRKLTASSRCRVWVNTRVLRAKNREEAYRKAMALGRAGSPTKTESGEWRFAGLAMLLPIYEKFDDGSEVMWDDYGFMTVSRIKKLAKGRRSLAVFDDRKKSR